MHSRLLPIALALLALLAGCVGPLQTDGGATAAETVDGPTIDVTGTGTVSADADLAVVLVTVVGRADTADEARAQAAADVESMRAALRDAGVPDEAVTTASYHLSPRYDYTERERQLLGYEAVHAFRVEVAPERAGEVVDLAVSGGADRVDGVQFTLADETRADLRERALTDAVDAARADADAIAAAADLTVTGVARASTGGSYTPVYDVRFAEGGAADGAATTFEPGPVTVTATVRVTYTAQ